MEGGLERRMRAVEESFERRARSEVCAQLGALRLARSEVECSARCVEARQEDLEDRVKALK